MKFVSLALLTVLALSTTSALAVDAVKPMEPKAARPDRFKETDTNNDATISKDEWRARGDKMFAERDANHDGKISQDEWKAHREAKRASWKSRHEAWVAEQGDKKPDAAAKPAAAK